jgi:hypothetical protein
LRLLPLAAAATLLFASLVPALGAARWPPPALWHLLFAVAALPMILAAMAYFVPVLTRSGASPTWLVLAPLTAGLAGIGIVIHFVGGSIGLRHAMPLLALCAVIACVIWLVRRVRACLGAPHPGLAWYAAALALLAAGLIAVTLTPAWPQQAAALRLFHLHINLLGFMGLTAIGTLQVLLPTVSSRHNPQATQRLRTDLPWSAGGALSIALGAALGVGPTRPAGLALALAGAAAYAWPLTRLVGAAWREWRDSAAPRPNVLPLLLAAPLGLALALGHGALHAANHIVARPALTLFALAFLLPLVSGAAGQLLPVWLAPGRQTDWHTAARQRLARGAGLRALALAAAGLASLADHPLAAAIGLTAALWLAVAMVVTALTRRSAP